MSRFAPLLRLGLVGLAGLLVSPALFAAGISTTNKYAWAENAGWLNFNATHGNVQVYNDHLEGYAWAENLGWIRLGSYTGGGTHPYGNTTAANYGVNHDGNGHLSGYAWSENAGWLNFQGVTVDRITGGFDGYAWGENIGYLHLHNAASPAYQVAVIDADNDGYSALSDCNDSAAAIHPGAAEVCDRQDNDCNPTTVERCPLGCPQ
ncbi:MAG: putative metal-binding motif-containing protein [Candidatus Competibacteraceae bacterium]